MKQSLSDYRISEDQLRWVCNPEDLGFKTTDEIEPVRSLPGQQRALQALKIGLGLRSQGYNIFIAGASGTSRVEALDRILEEFEDQDFDPEDFCYVHNFKSPWNPLLLRLPAGQGKQFVAAVDDGIKRMLKGIPRILSSEIYSKRRKARIKKFTSRLDELAIPLREKAKAVGLALVQIQVGESSEAELLPVIEEEPVAFEDLDGLVEKGTLTHAEARQLVEERKKLTVNLRAFSEHAGTLAEEATLELSNLDQEMIRPFINNVVGRIHSNFQVVDHLVDWLHEVETFLIAQIQTFASQDESADAQEKRQDVINKLQVNLILDATDVNRRPVIPEPNPTVANLRGTIDRDIRSGGRVVSDHRHIRAGAVLRAHRGFLLLHADDLEEEGLAAWSFIKRTLRTGQLRIEPESDSNPARMLRPQPIEIDVKVIVVGTHYLYSALQEADLDFPKLFKIKAEFDSEMELTPHSLTEYVALIRSLCSEADLPPVTAAGVASVVEFGVRQAGRRSRITTQYGLIQDLVRESAFWAKERDASEIDLEDVRRALAERRYRLNLPEERSQRLIREGVILIDVEGSRSGQINGLTAMDYGDYVFGRPVRITCSVGAGSTGIVNIERRAALSGSHHDKGLMILSGFLQALFAQDRPLAITAAITLEQSYSAIDGDSATLAEILALLSSISEVPLKQNFAITGSMNQMGDIQAVGAVNEKIEGFYDLCKARELTGDQGVIIPEANIPDLMLRPDLVEAVSKGTFHMYGVRRIEEAVFIMTGIPAGLKEDGSYKSGSVYAKVAAQLDHMSEASREFLPWAPKTSS